MIFFLVGSAIVLILIMPISVSGYAYYDDRVKKILFSLRLFDIINVFGGYIEFKKGVIFVHYKKKKAIAFGIFDGGESLSLSVLNKFTVVELKGKASVPIEEEYFKIALFFNQIANGAFWFLRASGSRADVSLDTEIGKESEFSVSFKQVSVFNLISFINLLFNLKRGK